MIEELPPIVFCNQIYPGPIVVPECLLWSSCALTGDEFFILGDQNRMLNNLIPVGVLAACTSWRTIPNMLTVQIDLSALVWLTLQAYSQQISLKCYFEPLSLI